MKRKFNTAIISTAILSLVFVVALSIAWAVNTYNGSVIIENGSTYEQAIQIIQQGNDHIKVEIEGGSLDAYMDEEDLNEVLVTCELTEELVSGPNGDYYKLNFEFGPSGAYFSPNPLVLKIKGKWVADDTEFWLNDENGEAIEGTRYDDADMIKFEIPHFSGYFYEGYNY